MDISPHSLIIIKVGTGTIIEEGKLHKTFLTELVEEVNSLMVKGKRVVIVTSGAIGLGKARLHFEKKETTLKEQQGLAAIGQIDLMMEYLKRFDAFGLEGAQVLLSQHDLLNHEYLANMRNAFEFLFENKVVPIVNENDVVATEELRHNGAFSDNDMLSVLLAKQINATLLVLLTTKGGLVGKDGIITELKDFDELITLESKSKGGRGGIQTKVEAIKSANIAGIDVFVSGPESFQGFAHGKANGTIICATKKTC
ncbi:MAG: glutamate 5-kinase [archaeon]|jgi:glutamate 5-kinase